MKRALIILGVVVAGGFVIITVLRWRADDKSNVASGADRSRQQVRDFWAEFNRAGSLRTQGNFREAAEAYRKCLVFDPRHEDSLYYLATSLHELGEYNEAVAILRKLIEVNPESARAHSQLGNTLSILAPGAPLDFNAARRAYRRNLEVNKEQAGPFLRLGAIDLNEGNFAQAHEHFRIATASGAPEAGYLASFAFFLDGQKDKAARPLLKIVEAYEKDKKITAKGVLSEGDILPGPDKRLTALERAGVKAMALLGWMAAEEGKQPAQVPAELQVKELAADPAIEWSRVPNLLAPGGRGAWGDADNDHHPDLVVAKGERPLAFYHNQAGRFVDATASVGLANVRGVWDATWLDYDGDGYSDLYLVRSGYIGTGRNQMFRNVAGRFNDVTAEAGLDGMRRTARAITVDCDGDGKLDLLELGAASEGISSVRLYRNSGGKFHETTREAGLQSSTTAVDAVAGDFDHDGKLDLAVLYWMGGPKIFRNLGAGRFEDATAAFHLSGDLEASFSLTVLDYDKDGWLDLVVSAQSPLEDAIRCLIQPNLHFARHTPQLWHNTGHGLFEDVTSRTGLDRSYGTMQVVAADFDADGWTDLLLANGGLDVQHFEPSVILRNEGGKKFREWNRLPAAYGASNCFGAAVSDVNGDGRPDIYLATHSLFMRQPVRGGLFVSRNQ
jgi:tetratricopeptide (TPR) repeat protein